MCCSHTTFAFPLYCFRISNLVVNVDLAPTILDMAGVDIPEHMDGRSVMKLIRTKSYRDQDYG